MLNLTLSGNVFDLANGIINLEDSAIKSIQFVRANVALETYWENKKLTAELKSDIEFF